MFWITTAPVRPGTVQDDGSGFNLLGLGFTGDVALGLGFISDVALGFGFRGECS